ncbi:MAG: ABC transporter substrate-binding protein [bacterium]
MFGKKLLIGFISALLVLSSLTFAFAKTTVTFWSVFTGDPYKSSIQHIVDEFNKQNPDIEVKVTLVAASAVTDVSKLMTAVAGGVGPDIYTVDRFTAAQRGATGILEPLNDLIKASFGSVETLQKEYLPFAWDEATWDGKVWVLPFDTDDRALYYRRDHIREVGLSGPPKTIAELDTYAEKLTKKDASGRFLRIGFIPWLAQGWHYTWGWAFGGEFYNPKTRKLTITDPRIVQSFEWQKSYADKYGIAAIQSFSSAFGSEAQDPFIMGMVSMKVDGDWTLAFMDKFAPKMKWGVDYGVTYIPRPAELAKKPITWAGGWSFGIPKGAKHAKEAFEFMKFACGPIGQKTYSIETLHLPTVAELLKDKDIRGERRHAFFVDLLRYAKNRPPLPVGALLWDELTAARDAVINGQKTPLKACQDVEARVQPELDKFFAGK